MNKADRDVLRRYRMSCKYGLYDAYKGFSKAKRDAWKRCEKLMEEYGGYGLKIIGANTHFFSVGFMFKDNGEEKLMYITRENNRVIDAP